MSKIATERRKKGIGWGELYIGKSNPVLAFFKKGVN